MHVSNRAGLCKVSEIEKDVIYGQGLPRWLSLQRICLPVQETQVPSLGWRDPLEEDTAAHSSILAWRIPWREEPGGLQYMGSQRLGHD